MSWGVFLSLGVGSLSYMGGMKAADAAYAASGRQAEELRLRAAARRSLMHRQAANLFKNYSSAEADYLNKQGDQKELMLMQLDQLIGKATSALGTSGVKLSEGTPKSLITQLRLEGAEARLRQDQEVKAASIRMETSYTSQREEIKEQGEAEASSMERTASNIRKSAHEQFQASKFGAVASFVGSTIQTAAAMEVKADDWKSAFTPSENTIYDSVNTGNNWWNSKSGTPFFSRHQTLLTKDATTRSIGGSRYNTRLPWGPPQ